MQSFNLEIITNDGVHYKGEASGVTVRTTTGDVSILARHIDYITAIGIGKATIQIDDKKRIAACMGGLLAVTNGDVKILASTFEWSDEIDEERAKRALEQARKVVNAGSEDSKAVARANIKIQRSLARLNVKQSINE